MDFVSRHANSTGPAASSTSASSTSESAASLSFASSSASNALPMAEEPEYLARYLVVKHSWRGRYKRILCLSAMAIITLDPSSLAVTNSYDIATDFEGATPILGRDENSCEFNLSVRTDGKGKFKAIKFSSRFRASILTELHRLRGSKAGPVSEYTVLHLRRRNAEWVPYNNSATSREQKGVAHEVIKCSLLLEKRERKRNREQIRRIHLVLFFV